VESITAVCGGGGEPLYHLGHVQGAVPAHVVHAHVEQVRPVAGLLPGDLDFVAEPTVQQRLAERLRPAGWCAIDGEE
jgi:hypothetical protein